MQTRSYNEKSVCLSVCLSGKRMHCDKTEERYVSFLYQNIYPSFLRRRMFGWGDPSTGNFGSTGSRWSEIADFESIIARSASAVIPSEKSSINTNRKSPTRFPISLILSSFVAPKSPKGGAKTQNLNN